MVIEVGSRTRNQPSPPRVVFEALVEPHRDRLRPWLTLVEDEVEPALVEEEPSHLAVWSSPWLRRPDARVRFDVLTGRPKGGSDLRQLTDAELRHSSGQWPR